MLQSIQGRRDTTAWSIIGQDSLEVLAGLAITGLEALVGVSFMGCPRLLGFSPPFLTD